MSKYTIIVKRGDFQYSIECDNRDFAVSHIDMLFSQLKTRVAVSGDDVFSKLDVKKEVEQPKTEYKVEEPKQDVVQEQFELKEEIPAEETIEPVVEEVFESENSSKVQEEAAESVVEAEGAQQETVLGYEPIDETQEFSEQEAILESEKNSFEHPIEENSDVLSASVSAVENVEETLSSFSFENILESKINNPPHMEEVIQNESVEEEISEGADYDTFIKNISAQGLEDYLIITAYYMLENEGLDKFSLKQLNQKLFTSMKLLIDRKTIQNAVENGMVQIVGEFSQDGITEYALTEQGRYRYINGYS